MWTVYVDTGSVVKIAFQSDTESFARDFMEKWSREDLTSQYWMTWSAC